MTQTYGELSLEVPDGWEDQTVVTLTGPVPKDATPLRPTRARTEPPSIVVKAIAPPKDSGLESFVETQEKMILTALQAAEVVPSKLPALPDVVVREYSFGPDSDRIRQVQLYVKREDRIFIVCGTANDDLDFEPVRRAARDVAESIQLSR